MIIHAATVVRLFFFFQAEDGIRDKLVTGVQTCALPISRIADSGSMKQPTTSSSTFSTARIIHGASSSERIQPTRAAGTWLTVRSHENTLAQATMIRICEVNIAVVPAASRISRHGMSRYTTRVTKAAYTQAIPAASVGENTPP